MMLIWLRNENLEILHLSVANPTSKGCRIQSLNFFFEFLDIVSFLCLRESTLVSVNYSLFLTIWLLLLLPLLLFSLFQIACIEHHV